MNDELIQYLIRKANKAGLEGKKIIQWVPPQSAGDDYRGTFLYQAKEFITTER